MCKKMIERRCRVTRIASSCIITVITRIDMCPSILYRSLTESVLFPGTPTYLNPVTKQRPLWRIASFKSICTLLIKNEKYTERTLIQYLKIQYLKNLTRTLKIIFLDHQNNYVGNSSMIRAMLQITCIIIF